jgi:hypothetical protein
MNFRGCSNETKVTGFLGRSGDMTKVPLVELMVKATFVVWTVLPTLSEAPALVMYLPGGSGGRARDHVAMPVTGRSLAGLNVVDQEDPPSQ